MEVDAKLMKSLEAVEKAMEKMSEKAEGEFATLGKVTKDTSNAIETIGSTQKELAERLQKLEQMGTAKKDDDTEASKSKDWGDQVVADGRFKSWAEGGMNKIRFTLAGSGSAKLKNTILTTSGSGGQLIQPQRLPGVIPGVTRNLMIEQYLSSADTTVGSVEWTRETSFTNNAAETAEGAQKPESALVFTLFNTPVQTVAHWIKISRQLSMDAPALAAYINNRMRYGVNKRVEDQLISGNGTSPNLSGLLASGNFTAHGYTDSTLSTGLGAGNKKLKLVRRMIADLATGDYPADVVMLNPSDWADIELITDSQGNYIFGGPGSSATPALWGIPVVASNAIPVDTVIVMSGMAATVYNREGVVVEMSESDGDNFTKNLITVRAERRLMLAVEIPAAIRAGDLTPA